MLKDYLHLHLLVFIWGFTAILGMLIHIPALEIVIIRTLLTFLIIGMIMAYRKTPVYLPYPIILKLLGTGVVIAGHWILFFAAERVANVSVCLAGLATCSFWTSIIEPLLKKNKIRFIEVALGIFVIIGLLIIFNIEGDYTLGLIMGIASALLAAVFSVLNSQFTQKYNPITITFYEMIGAHIGTFVIGGIIYHFLGTSFTLNPNWSDWIYLFILASICTVYAFTASIELMKRISAFSMNLTVNLEPVYGIILAFIFFGEHKQMTAGFYVGTALILAAVFTYPLLNRYYFKRQRKRKAIRIH